MTFPLFFLLYTYIGQIFYVRKDCISIFNSDNNHLTSWIKFSKVKWFNWKLIFNFSWQILIFIDEWFLKFTIQIKFNCILSAKTLCYFHFFFFFAKFFPDYHKIYIYTYMMCILITSCCHVLQNTDHWRPRNPWGGCWSRNTRWTRTRGRGNTLIWHRL